MSIFRRVQDIISANINDMVDRWEDPEKMLRQAIREMEKAIDDAKPSIAKSMANDRRMEKDLAALRMQIQEADNAAAKAVDRDDDDAARAALKSKRDLVESEKTLAGEYEEACAVTKELRSQLETMQERLSEAERRLGTLVAKKKSAEISAQLSSASLDSDHALAQAKYEKLVKRVEQAEAEASAMRELSAPELGAVASTADPDVEDELAALKQSRKS